MLLSLIVLASYTDLKWGKIFNWYTIPGIFLGFAANFFEGHLIFQKFWNPLILQSLLGFFVGFGVFFLLYLTGGFGAGDMKLAGAIGAIMGLSFCLEALVYTSLVGAAMGISALIWHGKLWQGIQRSVKLLFGRREEHKEAPITIPYGLAISLGTLWAYWMRVL